MSGIAEKEYVARNLKGFEGDIIMKETFEALIKKHEIDLIIETGTFKGGTTNQLSKMVKEVITIEVNEQYFNEAAGNIEDKSNVVMINGSSPSIIDFIFKANDHTNKKILFFLDAHWGNVCPLLDELKKIAEAELQPVIIIHDFFVPDRPDFGYDSYNGKKFDFDFIHEAVVNIYGERGYVYFYNTEATGAKRGIIYIEPK